MSYYLSDKYIVGGGWGGGRETAAVQEVVYQENMTTLPLNTHDAKNIKNLM
jgi:hypothetical protein